MNNSEQDPAYCPVVLKKQNSFIGYLSWIAIWSTIFAGFSFVNNSLIGMFFAVIVIIVSFDIKKIDALQFFSIFALFLYCSIILILAIDKVAVLQNIRYWFGFLVYVLFFIVRRDTRLISFGIVRFLSLSVLIESLLINTVITSQSIHYGSNETNVIFAGWYERPLSFAGNPGTTGFALLVLFFLVEKLLNTKATKLDLLLLILAIFVLVSSTALVGLILLLIFRSFNGQRKRYAIMAALILTMLFFYLLLNVNVEYIQKFSIDYFIGVFNNKLDKVDNIQIIDGLNFLFGNQRDLIGPVTSGDFGWLLLFFTTGLLGVAIYFLNIFSFYSGGKSLFPVLLLMFIGTIHYPAAMSPIGQLVLAMVLTFGPLYHSHRVSLIRQPSLIS